MRKWVAIWFGEPWIVLCLSLGGAISIWFIWVKYGIAWAFARVSQVATATSSVASAASASSSDVMAQIGQSGDAFGGGNALFAAVAGGLVFWAGFMQAKSLKEARAAYERQQFESTFFELLALTRVLLERFETNREDPSSARSGAAALDSYAFGVDKAVKENVASSETLDVARKLVRTFSAYYRGHPSAFGPYFRSMYQTFKLVADSSLSPHDQTRFANIARGQISEGAVFLLAMNGMTELGFNVIPYIEKFGLREHMHRQYLARYKPAFRLAYHDRAFLGSKQRDGEPCVATSKQRSDYFVREVEEPIAAGGLRTDPDLSD